MTPITILKEEHHLIREALENFILAKKKMESGETPPVAFFERGVEFIRSFVQKYHHFKEEYVMFQRLAEKKNGTLDAQIDALRYQHERGRDLVLNMAEALEGYKKGLVIQTTLLLESLAAYPSLLRQHIHKEEHLFFPLVEKVLTDPEMEALLELFNKEEKKWEGGNWARDLIRDMGKMLTH